MIFTVDISDFEAFMIYLFASSAFLSSSPSEIEMCAVALIYSREKHAKRGVTCVELSFLLLLAAPLLPCQGLSSSSEIILQSSWHVG